MASIEPKNVTPIMFGLVLSLFLANLDQTIVATCLPAIARDLDGWDLLPWIVSSYLVTSTATTPIYGRLSDIYGRRPMLLASIALFVAASALCALAPTMPALIAARALQGAGGGGLRAISQIVIADIIPPRFRGKYQGWMSGTFLVSTALGPVLGGFFAEHVTWQWAFWINLPLGAIAFFVIDRQLRKLTLPTRSVKVDWIGALCIVAFAAPLMIGISQVEQQGGWLNLVVMTPLLAGLVAGVVLVWWELRAPEPMLPMRLFSNNVYTLGNVALAAPSMTMTAMIIIIPLYYQVVLNWSADAAGPRLIALTAGMSIGSFIVGSAITRTGRARVYPIVAGFVAVAVCLLIARVGLGTSLVFDLLSILALGAALGCQINPMLVIVPNGLEIRDIGAGVSGMTFFRSLAGAFGVAVFTTFLVDRLAAGAALVPGHEKLGANLGVGMLRRDMDKLFDASANAAFDVVRQSAFSHVFVMAAGLTIAGVVALAAMQEKPLRANSGLL